MTQTWPEESAGARVLLVGSNSQLISAQAIMLNTHGYDVETVSSASEARRRWRIFRPHLVLVALGDNADRNFGLWQGIRESDPEQRIGFLLHDSQYLCRVHYNGDLLLKGEGPEDIVERVKTMLG